MVSHFFEAPNMQEAFALVTQAFGEEAEILQSGENAHGVWLVVRAPEGAPCLSEEREEHAMIAPLRELLEKEHFSEEILSRFAHFSKSNKINRKVFENKHCLLEAFFRNFISAKRLFDFSVALEASDPPCFFFVGPTGQGKTITTAKLAVAFMRQGITPTIVSSDLQKIGGLAQLEGLLRPLDLLVHYGRTRKEFQDLFSQVPPQQPILVDTPGLNLFERQGRDCIKLLKEWTKGVPFGLLRAGGDFDETRELLRILLEEGVQRVGITHCDTVRYLGPTISAVLTSGVTLEFLCNSPFIKHSPYSALPENLVETLFTSARRFSGKNPTKAA